MTEKWINEKGALPGALSSMAARLFMVSRYRCKCHETRKWEVAQAKPDRSLDVVDKRDIRENLTLLKGSSRERSARMSIRRKDKETVF